MPFILRALQKSDFEQVSLIEREAFPTLWPRTSFKDGLKSPKIDLLVVTQRTDGSGFQSPGPTEIKADIKKRSLIARGIISIKSRIWPKPIEEIPLPGTALGFVSTWFLTDEAHITTIAVKKDWRGQGLGELLLSGAIDNAINQGSRVVTLEVRISNDSAISLYQKYGFRRVGTRKKYYTDNGEDAAIMTTEPVLSLSYQRRFEELKQAYTERRRVVLDNSDRKRIITTFPSIN
tara:strand:+ start:831 stop:1532 length:702 start_codon:yes stop_codon:yes gene_type:complete